MLNKLCSNQSINFKEQFLHQKIFLGSKASPVPVFIYLSSIICKNKLNLLKTIVNYVNFNVRYYSNVQAILLLTAASLKLRFVITGLIFRVIYSYKREKYHSEEHLQAVREEGEDSEHAEDVEDGLLQNLDVNGTLHNLFVRETRTWDLMF
jgi:hypothetical protein